MAITLDGTNGVTTPDLTVDTDTLTVNPSNNRVGIGTVSPPQKFVVSNAGADNIVMAENSSASIQMFMQAQSGVGAVGTLTNHDTVFLSNNSEKGRFLAGGGLTFNGDTAAANALDDYEEGAWTPAIGGSGATYLNQQGIYTKIGRYVCASFDITINARNSGSTNELHGFPFTASLGGQGVNSGHISFYSGVSQNLYSLDMYIINGQTYAYFTGHTSASGSIGNSLAVWQNSARILGTVHYFAN